eukprot:1429191-Rhodomonas_salina.1
MTRVDRIGLVLCFVLWIPSRAAIADYQPSQHFGVAHHPNIQREKALLLTRKLSAFSPISSEPELANLVLRDGMKGRVVDEAVLVLDLDKTALLGSDGNDLGLALQWMEKPPSVVKELYSRILSPCIRPMYDKLKSQARKVHVVIYTRRPSTL